MLIKSFLAFGAGFISFLTPCVLPIIPGYICYITGKRLDEIDRDKKVVLIKTIIFSLGFSFVFISLGMAASFIGNVMYLFQEQLRILAGTIIIVLALNFLGILNFKFLNKNQRFETGSFKSNYFFPFIVGAAFAFGWTPCIGPVLGSILILSTTETTVASGGILLTFYSLGLAVPFILSGYFMTLFLNKKKGFSKYYKTIIKTGGAILLATGVLIISNQIQVISYYLLTIFPFLTKFG